VQRVLEKLDFRSRVQLIARAHEGGWAERLA
jgi:DNA-binding NarL/FixJ family response regulator